MVTNCIFYNKPKREQQMEEGEKNGGILTYGEAKREQKKAEQKRGTRLQKEKSALEKPTEADSKRHFLIPWNLKRAHLKDNL